MNPLKTIAKELIKQPNFHEDRKEWIKFSWIQLNQEYQSHLMWWPGGPSANAVKLLTAVRLWADQSKNYDKFTTLEKENDYEIFCIQGEVRT